MRLGIGGGGRVLRGGVSVGRGGARGGIGVGPFHLSGGSRGSRSSMSDETAEIFIFFFKIVLVFLVFGVIILLVAGPLLYLNFILALLSPFAGVIAFWRLFYGRHHGRVSVVSYSVLAHAGAFGFMHLQRWFHDYMVRQIPWELAYRDSDLAFFENPRYWSWWSRQSNTLIEVIRWLDIYLLLPSFVVLTVHLVASTLRYRNSPPRPEKLAAVKSRMEKFENIVKQNQFELDLSNLSKKERQKVMTWMQTSVAEMREFWRSQLDLHPAASVSPRQTKRYSQRFETEIREFLELERQDGFVLEREMSHQKRHAISGLSAHRLSEIALLLGKKRISEKTQGACPNCSELFPAGTTLCPKCGTSMLFTEGMRVNADPGTSQKQGACPNCYELFPAGTTPCPKCGTSILFTEGMRVNAVVGTSQKQGACPNCYELFPAGTTPCPNCATSISWGAI